MGLLGRQPRRPLSLGLQIARMRRQFPGFRYVRSEGAWYGDLQPVEGAPHYRVKLSYVPGGVPKVWVQRPELVPEARTLHRYPDGSLCLYYPEDGDWHGGRYLAETIVPWAAEWLFFYEVWLIDPERRWRGPEAPHGSAKVRR